MKKHVLVNAREREKRWIFTEGNKIIRFEAHQPDHHSKVGNIYSGVVESIKPSLNAAFVSFDKGRNGYLSLKEIPWAEKGNSIQSVLHQGQRLMVQVKKDESAAKGAVLTGNIEYAGSFFVYFPFGRIVAVSKKINNQGVRKQLADWAEKNLRGEEGLIIRTEAEVMEPDVLETSLEELRKKATVLMKEFDNHSSAVFPLLEQSAFSSSIEKLLVSEQKGTITIDQKVMFDAIEQFLKMNPSLQWNCELYQDDQNLFNAMGMSSAEEKVMKKVVWLDGGISIVIEKTEALTVIDVNSGKLTKSGDERQMIRKINERAAAEIVYQLQLRDVSGIIIIDFINMNHEEDRETVTKAIQKQVLQDYKHIEVIGFTELSLFQLTRKRTRPSFEETKSIRCPVCQGKGTILSPASLAFQLERELYEQRRSIDKSVAVKATKDVIEAFKGKDGSFAKELQGIFGFSIEWNEIPHQHPAYEVIRLN
ncbi:Rne/Rng family ribonuclease [Jeotgalibacillus sp. S-D1]|uniref:Rne/Rng family ribonuclease n=1 Tax=Jeotgalibacillus sp. S-D1 TaxID=2552189 RepID=UPI00105985E5|nr:Rne/Rng family ribonuclease [Jeotgalibacillus sp. S-D1]TDL34416.1 Rne/Rng family ribonuclease [Jeotgalibacillus sp. S-D1]